MTLPASEVVAHEAPSLGEIEPEGVKVAGRSPTRLALTRLVSDKLSMISLTIVVLYFLAAVTAPLLSSLGVLDALGQHPDLLDVNAGNVPAGSWGGITWSHPLGVEPGLGRDVLSRLLLGISFSLAIAFTGATLTIVFGAVLGIVSGFTGGFVDAIVGRIVDLTLSFPQTLMLLALSGIAIAFLTETLHLGPPNFANGLYVVVVLAAFGWPPVCRVVRGQVISLREREFVEAAKVLGASRFRIYFKEILPNLWAPLLVYFTLTVPSYISAEAALSYLGVGVKPPTPTLGNILTDSISYSIADPVFFFVPAVFLALIVVCFNLLGDGLRDALDPKSNR
jgi:peptide/nickel transport system permease protein